jgi:signal transduction histidine kinase
MFPLKLDGTNPAVAAVRERTPFVVQDSKGEVARRRGFRSLLIVPMLSKGEAIGAVHVSRPEPGPFSDEEIGLLKTFANQAVIAIENTRLFGAEQASKRELQESLEYQTAISNVLGIISRSPSDLQPVMDAIVGMARSLCKSERAVMWKLEGGEFKAIAFSGFEDERRDDVARVRVPLGTSWLTGRAVLERKSVHVIDPSKDASLVERNKAFGESVVGRTTLAVPLLISDRPFGAMTLSRKAPAPYSEKQIALVETFADQAVIAIENTRLFEAEQASKRELTESLEQQTATADVLKVISRSALDVQKVLDALVESAARLCDANDAAIFQVFGNSLRLVAHHGQIPTIGPVGQLTIPLERGSIGARAVIDRRTIQVADILAEGGEYPESRKRALQNGHRTALAVPLVHAGEAIGFILIRRGEVRPFTERQIELVNTFADQAVIAIENTRLFEEVQARNRETRVALEHQTATSELLKVIGRSTLDVNPVFETLAENAVKLCEAQHAFIFRFDGMILRCVATYNIPPELKEFVEKTPVRPARGSGAGRAALERRTIQIEDIRTDPEFTYGVVQVGPMRTLLAVPMLRADELLGVIVITRPEVRLFTGNQVALMENFADQAVIAIENTRLFEEVQSRTHELTESLEQQTATSEVLSVISKSPANLAPVFRAILEKAVRICEAEFGVLLGYENDTFKPTAWVGVPPNYEEFLRARGPFRPDSGAPLDRLLKTKRLVLSADEIAENSPSPAARHGGARLLLAVPMFKEDNLVGAIVIYRTEVRPFIKKHAELVSTFANQAVIAVENTKLFEELQARTSELAKSVEDLEIASQHKNQFVANMSHELRTPLAAILGYAELIQEGFYGEQPEKSLDALTRIRSNGKHLLGLINTVLDIAKIESGQFTLNMTEYAIESVVETVRAATESLAQNKKLTLTTSVDKSLPTGLGDEQRLTQVLLNLVGNAIKFTDTGEVSIAAGARNSHFTVSVTDTGPGIPLDQQDRIFDQFHQVDSSLTKAKGGTGLGLAIAKQIVEMHGGRIWVESTPGKGSTFQMELPTRAKFHKWTP